MSIFKAPETFWSPSGKYVVIRPHVDPASSVWIVRLLDFASWQHVTKPFKDEASARKYADMWRL